MTSTRLPIKVVAGASRTEIVGWLDDTLRLRVTKPAERGKANAAVVELLSQTLGTPRSAVRIISGMSTPRKIVEIDLDESEVHRLLHNYIHQNDRS